MTSAVKTYWSICPPLFNACDSPELMAVFCKLLSNPLQVRRKDNLKWIKHLEDKGAWIWRKGRLRSYLYRVHGARSEGCVWKGLSGTQQVADAIEIMLVLLDGLNPQPVPRQHCFIAWSVAGWWEELKIPVTASQKKAKPWEIWRQERELLCHYYTTTKFRLKSTVVEFLTWLLQKS